jgi:endoglucanase
MELSMARMPLVVAGVVLAGGSLAWTTALPSYAAPAPAPVSGVVRVNQQGYLPGETKLARVMTTRPVQGERFRVVDARGRTRLRGTVPSRPVGRWNASYPAVYKLGLSQLRTSGRYRVVVAGPVRSVSPWFRVLRPGGLFGTLLRDGVRFDQVQRDGSAIIPGALHRKPSHLLDHRAYVYKWPRMEAGGDLILDPDLTRTGGPVDVAGGWFDAGDYLKFTHSSAYNDVLLFTSARQLGGRAPEALVAEARHGLAWLSKMWDPTTRTLHIQVGIGSGNEQDTFRGDHDGWRLPEADDHDTAVEDRYVAHRPVFDAAPAGKPISPNLVGRVAASYALAAQLDARHHRSRALAELHQATLLYSRADTASPPNPLVTALPHDFYPEDTWRDDMELGAAEIALAKQGLHLRSAGFVAKAAHWAHAYLARETGDTLNLYDTSALAHTALAQAMGHRRHLEVTRADLVHDLGAQIRGGVRHAAGDPFAAGVAYDDFDVNSHTFGLIATVALYDQLTHTRRFQSFATAQRTWLLGGDPWGVGAMVGVGTRFPRCMQHQVANLSGSPDGTPPLDVGAVVNGPNGADNFEDGLGDFQDGMVHCSAGASTLPRFDARGSRYVDDVRSWQTDEPALDMTGAAIIAAATQLHLHPHASLGR